jgi:hypothetical protein
MKPTKLWSLATYLIAAAVFAFVLAHAFVTRGFAVPVSPINLPITLLSVGIALGFLAIPMARYRKALKEATKNVKRVPPLYAFRVVVLAKATSIAGSLFLGWHLGVLLVQLTLPTITPAIGFSILGAAAALVTTVIAVVVEYLFRIPPDLNDTIEGTPA